VLLPKIKKIPKNTNGRLAIPALAGLLVFFMGEYSKLDMVKMMGTRGKINAI